MVLWVFDSRLDRFFEWRRRRRGLFLQALVQGNTALPQ